MFKTYKFDIQPIIICILLIIVFFEKCYDNGGEKNVVTIDGKKFDLIKYNSDTFEVYSTTSLVKKGDDIYKEIYRVDTLVIENEIDTQAILKDYFVKNVYKDTFPLNDDLGFVFVVDTVTKNRLTDRKWTAHIKQRKIQDTKTVQEVKKNQYFIGVNANFDRVDYLNSVGTSLLVRNKKDKLYQFNLGLSTNQPASSTTVFTPYVGGGLYWQIK